MAKKQRTQVMLIDDDPDFLLQQKARFETAGYSVTTADGARLARTVLEQAEPDVVVMDLMMGEMDAGIVLSREIKQKYPGLPIILVTGVTRETGMVFDGSTAEGRRWLNVDEVMSKPVRFDQLKGAIDGLLARQVRQAGAGGPQCA